MEPQEQELLAALEDAYNRGITLEQMEGNISDDAMAIAQDFFSKKKMVPQVRRSPLLGY